MKLSLSPLAVLVAASTVALASNHHRRQHHSISRLTYTNETEGSELYPRAGDSKWTWYDTEESGNAGACGNHIKNYENAVAWPLSEFNFNEHCFKKLTISFEGRSEVVTVLDACEACPHNGLDLSRDLFKKIAPNGDGVVFGSWIWGENGGGQVEAPPVPSQTTPTGGEAVKKTTSPPVDEQPEKESKEPSTPSPTPNPTTPPPAPTSSPAQEPAPATSSESTAGASPIPISPAAQAAPTSPASSGDKIVVGRTIRICKGKLV